MQAGSIQDSGDPTQEGTIVRGQHKQNSAGLQNSQHVFDVLSGIFCMFDQVVHGHDIKTRFWNLQLRKQVLVDLTLKLILHHQGQWRGNLGAGHYETKGLRSPEKSTVATTHIEKMQVAVAILHGSFATPQVHVQMGLNFLVDAGEILALPSIAVGCVHAANGLGIMNRIQINMRAVAAATDLPLFDFKKLPCDGGATSSAQFRWHNCTHRLKPNGLSISKTGTPT
jgi:hypothetical protein